MPDDQLIPTGDIERRIYLIRGQRVMLDRDPAELYGVTTAALNQAVKRNSDRFQLWLNCVGTIVNRCICP